MGRPLGVRLALAFKLLRLLTLMSSEPYHFQRLFVPWRSARSPHGPPLQTI
jgi:hypothetical protein